MVMDDPAIHQFISYLAGKKREQETTPGKHISIELSREFIEKVRDSFKQHILRGELNLHLVSHVLASHFLGRDFELHSNVIGTLPGGENRPFMIRERITPEMLFSQTDLDLGNLMLANFQYRGSRGWNTLTLAANFIEYIPATKTPGGVNRLTSRVKAEEELWNKVADELFGLDELIRRDKHLRQFSKYIKDVFGLKIVCGDDNACLDVHARLQMLSRGECAASVPGSIAAHAAHLFCDEPEKPLFEFIETKDYLTCESSQMKTTGWKALKSVVRWEQQILEIQVQPLGNYYLELDHMSGPSHRSFKFLRDTLRKEVAGRIPLYGFYRDLLRSLFLNGTPSFEYQNASVLIME
jgi:hypothetical protein